MARQEAAVAVHLLYLTQEVPAVGDYAKGELINCRKRKRNNLTKYPFSPQGGACITAHPYSQPMSSISAWKRGGEEEKKKERKQHCLHQTMACFSAAAVKKTDACLLSIRRVFHSFPFPSSAAPPPTPTRTIVSRFQPRFAAQAAVRRGEQ
jgi:hypothetical protein